MSQTPVSAQTQLLVDIDALKHNYRAIKDYVGEGVKVLPVIKADAYGTGASLLARIYDDCDFFAIADLTEAEELHKIMPTARFLVLYQPFVSEVGRIAERDCIVPSVSSWEFARELNFAVKKAAEKSKKSEKSAKKAVHIEIDTGMSRLGIKPERCSDFAKVMSECEHLFVEGVYTHYASADSYNSHDLDFTAAQTAKFKKAVAVLERGLEKSIAYKHACASAAIFNPNTDLFNMVRPGYILRGYYPCEQIRGKIDLRPALKFVTKVTLVQEYEKGIAVSYCGTFTTSRTTRIAKVPVGYDDGLKRCLSNKGGFVINGQLAPIVGNVTMDYTMVDVTDITPQVRAGDDVAVFDNEVMTIERMAELCGTIGYEIFTSIKNKADKIECF